MSTPEPDGAPAGDRTLLPGVKSRSPGHWTTGADGVRAGNRARDLQDESLVSYPWTTRTDAIRSLCHHAYIHRHSRSRPPKPRGQRRRRVRWGSRLMRLPQQTAPPTDSWQGRSRTGIVPINNRALDHLSYLPLRGAWPWNRTTISRASIGRPAIERARREFPRVDSNHDDESQSLASCRWTTGNGSRAWSRTRTFYRIELPVRKTGRRYGNRTHVSGFTDPYAAHCTNLQL